MFCLEGRAKTEEGKNSLLRPADIIYTKGIKSSFNRKSTFSHHSKQDSGGFFLNWSLYCHDKLMPKKRVITIFNEGITILNHCLV